MKHPLLNEDSKHYCMVDGVDSIDIMELLYTTEELATWAKISAFKYRLRLGHKDEVTKEAKKIKTYEDYYLYLQNKLKTKLEHKSINNWCRDHHENTKLDTIEIIKTILRSGPTSKSDIQKATNLSSNELHNILDRHLGVLWRFNNPKFKYELIK